MHRGPACRPESKPRGLPCTAASAAWRCPALTGSSCVSRSSDHSRSCHCCACVKDKGSDKRLSSRSPCPDLQTGAGHRAPGLWGALRGFGGPPGASAQRQPALGPHAPACVILPCAGWFGFERQSHWERTVSPLPEDLASPPRPAGAAALVAGESGVRLRAHLWQRHLLFSRCSGTSRPARVDPDCAWFI